MVLQAVRWDFILLSYFSIKDTDNSCIMFLYMLYLGLNKIFRGKKKTLVMAIDFTEAWSSSLEKNLACCIAQFNVLMYFLQLRCLCHAVQENVC